MQDESADDTDDEIYTLRSRRSRHLVRMNRLQRRTALSLRPIRQKCYADPRSPSHYNSDSEAGVRRSKRKSNLSNMSWLADSQMPKVGYPTLNTGYSEEDSRDAAEGQHIEMSRRVTRRSNDLGMTKTKYLFEYDNEEEPSRSRRKRTVTLHTKKEARRESNDTESKKDVSPVNNRSYGRLLRSIKDETLDENEEDNDVGEAQTNENGQNDENENEQKQDDEQEGDDDNSKEKPNADEKNDNSSDSDDAVPLARTTRNRTRGIIPSNNYSTRNNYGNRNNYSTRNNLLHNYPTRNNLILTRNDYSRNKMEKSDSSSESEEVTRKYEDNRKYSLRERRPKPAPKTMQTSILKECEIRPRRRFTRRRQSSTSSSDSSSDVRISNKNIKSTKNEKMKTGAGGSSNIEPIKPETLDKSITFNTIGGLDEHIQCLKEMILLPMMYPEVFKQFQVQPPRGVLFHGPPGTGKTLIARALANECSFGKKKISFFLRKGADLLSKWIGESEKQLRLLFEQAAEKKPSIIFFDELDGLAPVRSSRQDQVHASIVSTLLALMDGLTDRGDVVVIGATNRIDAIDPALRRPGRFDRELFFPLPSRNEREEILKVHLSSWATPPTQETISYLAENTVGYCGSDLRALCSEAVIQSFRRIYPQVYGSDHKLLLQPENVKVEKIDFIRARSLLVPASHRVSQRLGRKLFPVLDPLLQDYLKKCLGIIQQSFPHGLDTSLAKVKLSPNVRLAQLLITGDGPEHGQTTHLAPAVLFKMEHIHAHLLDLAVLYQDTGRSTEEACIQMFHEARRNIPSIIFVPCIDKLWDLVSDTVKALLMSQLAQLDPNIPILFMATAECLYDSLPQQLQKLFSHYRNEVVVVKGATADQRRQFFRPLIVEGSLKDPQSPRKRSGTPPPLPRAPTPPPSPLDEVQCKKLYETEEHTLRELRIFLRDMCKKLANNKLFFMFTKPVDTEEVPDYTTIIKKPMDLETMMMKVDFHKYECARDFLNDIELICQNALEYNPARTSADKQIRHRACSLRDYAYTLIKTEMDSDFEDKCQDISKKRKERKYRPTEFLPPYIYTPENLCNNGNISEENKEEKSAKFESSKIPHRKRKIRNSWSRGFLTKAKRRKFSSQDQIEEKMSTSDEPKENDTESRNEQKDVNSDKPTVPEEQLENNRVEPDRMLTINCDYNTPKRPSASSSLLSPKRALSNLLSPSELLDNPLDFDDVEEALNESAPAPCSENRVECSQTELEKALDQVVKVTEGCTLITLLDLYNQLNRIVKRYSRTHCRSSLPKQLSEEISRFKGKSSKRNSST
nr:unnamed protein product [Callosobruchus chinensis]